jgi:hypothetical protein
LSKKIGLRDETIDELHGFLPKRKERQRPLTMEPTIEERKTAMIWEKIEELEKRIEKLEGVSHKEDIMHRRFTI